MSFPTVPSSGTTLQGLNQLNTTATLTGPNLNTLTMVPGDLLIAIAGEYGTSAATSAAFSGWAGGGLTWTEIADGGTSSTNRLGVAIARVVTGSETGTVTVTRAATITTNGDASMIVLVISGAHATTNPEVTATATGTGTAAPAALSPSWGADDTLWIGVNGNGMTSGTGSWTANNGAPTSYTGYFGTNPTDTSTVGDFGLAVAFRQLNASSETMGAFSQDTSNARNSVLLVAVRPAPSGNADVTGVAAAVTVDAGAGTPHWPPGVTHLTTLVNAYPGSAQSVWNTASVSAADGDVVFIFLEQNESTAISPPAVSSVAGLGNSAWNLGITRYAWEGVFRTATFYWTAVSGAQTGAITITLASADTGAVMWSVVNATGYDTTTPFVVANLVTASATSGTSVTKAYAQAFASGGHGLAFTAHHANETTTARSSPAWTALGESHGGPSIGVLTQWIAGTDTSCSASWTTSSSNTVIGLELTPAGGGGTSADVTGVAASVTVAAGTGTPSSGQNVTGAGAAVTVAGGTGSLSAGENTAGTGAAVTVAAGTGTPSSSANVTGTGAAVTVAAGTGMPSGGGAANVSGVAAAVTVAGGVGIPQAGAAAAGTGAAVSVAVTGGTPAGGAGVTGVRAPVSVAAGAGTVAASASIAGVAAQVTAAAGTGVASGGVSGAADVSGVAAAVSVAAGTGTVRAGAASAGTGAAITVAAGTGTAGGGTPANVTGTAAAVAVAAGTGTPAGGGAVTGSAALILATVTAGTLHAAANLAGQAALVAVLAGTGTGAAVNATSAPTVTDPRDGTASVSGAAHGGAVAAQTTSAPTAADPRDGSRSVAAAATSTPTVTDG